MKLTWSRMQLSCGQFSSQHSQINNLNETKIFMNVEINKQLLASTCILGISTSFLFTSATPTALHFVGTPNLHSGLGSPLLQLLFRKDSGLVLGKSWQTRTGKWERGKTQILKMCNEMLLIRYKLLRHEMSPPGLTKKGHDMMCREDYTHLDQTS